jgi:hypothetical protein
MQQESLGPLHGWSDCYVILATGAATFASAMFIVVTLGVRFLSAERNASVYFQAATMAHLAFVLFGSALAMAPWSGPGPAGFAFVAFGLVGLGYAIWVEAHVHRRQIILLDHLCYGAAPPLCYAMITMAGLTVAEKREPLGTGLLAAGFAALLAVSIRNAWDLLVFFAGRPEGASPENTGTAPQSE